MTTRFLRLPELMQTVSLSRSAIYEKVADGQFPKPVRLSGRAVGWLSNEVEDWCTAQVKASREAA
jgi:prophage regulatory protein